MFTGIVEEVGRVQSIVRRPDAAVLTIAAHTVLDDVHIGDSIAVCGVCLTVTSFTRIAIYRGCHARDTGPLIARRAAPGQPG